MKLSILEGAVIFIILTTFVGVAAIILDRSSRCDNPPLPKYVVPVAPPLEEEPIIEDPPDYTFPKLGDEYVLPLPVPDGAEPELTWKEVEERLPYLRLARKLGNGDKQVSAVGNTFNLIVSNTSLSATTFHNRWRQSIKRAGLPLKGKNLWVTVVGNNSYVEKTHHCTKFGKH